MEFEWYRSQAENWYDASAAQTPPPKQRRVWPWIALTLLTLLALIIVSCVLFSRVGGVVSSAEGEAPQQEERSGGFGFVRPQEDETLPGEDGFYDDFRDFFENYYTPYESAEPCEIPTVEAAPGLQIQLQEPEGSYLSLQQIYERCSPSIVAISAYSDPDSDDSYSWGTGVIFDAAGYIVTNSHVVEGSRRANVTLQDNREFEALLVGNDSRSDIAILKIDASGLVPAEFATSDGLQVGDEVVAIGNPLGDSFRCTMTNGIISGIDRDISHNGATLTLIQTNAALNEGNSGGALINRSGQVIGITNMKMSNSYAGSVTIEGIGFAIPSVTMKAMADSILSEGRVVGRPALGITVGAIPSNAASHYDLPGGLYVTAVSPQSDCAAKGMQPGDIITHVNGSPVAVTSDITGLIADMSIGDTLTFTIFREGRTFDLTVSLVEMNDVY